MQYRALTPIKLNQERTLKIGELIDDLSAESAAELIAIEAIEPVVAPFYNTPKSKESYGHEQTISAD